MNISFVCGPFIRQTFNKAIIYMHKVKESVVDNKGLFRVNYLFKYLVEHLFRFYLAV